MLAPERVHAPPRSAQDPPRGDRSGRRRLPRIAGALTSTLGVLVLLGWGFDVESLKRVAPDLPPLVPVSAIGLLLCGAALLLAQAAAPRARATARGVGGLVAYLGVHTLMEHLLGHRGWLLYLLMPAEPGEPRSGQDALPHVASVCFALFGLCLALGDTRRELGRMARCALATAGLVIATGSVLGYVFGADALLGTGVLRPIAVHAAAGFVLLFVGALALRPDSGRPSILTGPEPAAKTGRSLLLLVLVLPAVSARLAWEGERRGLFGEAFLLALMTLVAMVVLAALVLFHTRRTARLYAGQLAASKALGESEARQLRAADEENRRKDEFLAVLAHELRSPWRRSGRRPMYSCSSAGATPTSGGSRRSSTARCTTWRA